MKCFISETDFYIEEPTVVTIGKFDGRHKGHQKLLNRMLDWKQTHGWRLAVFTFDMSHMFQVDSIPKQVITTDEERRNNMADMGVDYLVEYPFTRQVSSMEPERFVKEILRGKMNAKAIVVGTDCGFGYQRSGNADLLKALAPELGYEVEVVEKEQDDHRDISSSYVKEELDRGNMEKVTELLGQPYAFHGTVVHGNHIGGPVLGVPTANLIPPVQKYLPPFGVYVSRVLLDGKYYGGMTNIGRKPTVEGQWPVGVETLLFGWEGDLYGKEIQVELLNFERPEQKFASLDELKAQLRRDREYAGAYLAQHKILQKTSSSKADEMRKNPVN